jgi:atypical dual specificity phosphatase
MSQIDDTIWIGSYGDAANEEFQSERKITHILCCADEFKNPPGFMYIKGTSAEHWYRLPIVDDVADSSTEEYFREGAVKLNEWVTQGHRVIVHCYAGISRSVSTVIAYYMLYKGWSFDMAYSHIKQRRWQMNPHPAFLPILKGLAMSE